MKTIAPISSSTASKYYYEKDPIFNPDGKDQANIEWYGQIAKDFGIEGKNITGEEAYNLFQGKSLDGEEQLLDRSKSITSGNERAVFDAILAPPKPVSALGLMEGGDKRILELHKQAVKATIEHTEKNIIATRGYIKQEDGSTKRETYKTGNALIASVSHSTNRNNDLHMHNHMLISNMTYDKNTNSYKSLNLDFVNDPKEMNSVYQSEMMKGMRELGYQLEIRDNGAWNVVGFDEKTIEAMSTRKEEIVDAKSKLDSDNINKMTNRKLGYETKNDKNPNITEKDIQERAKNQLASVGTTIQELKENALNQGKYVNYFSSAKEVLEYTAEKLTQSDARFTERELLSAASEVAQGEFTHKELKNELSNVKKIGQKENNELKRLGTDQKGNEVFTTKEMHQIEKENIQSVKNNIQVNGIMTKEQAEEAYKDFAKEYFELTKGQKDAGFQILTSTDQIGAIQGDAGTGKSTMLKFVAHALEYQNSNVKVAVSSLSNKAVEGAKGFSQTKDGKSFEGRTLHNLTKQDGLNNFVKGDQKGQTQRVKDISKNLNDIHLSTGSKSFSNNKGFSIDPMNKFSINSFKNFETSSKSSKTNYLTGSTTYKKITKVKSGEHKGATKNESTTVNQSGTSIKYQSTIKANNGEVFKQKIETFSPVKLGGRNGSPIAKLGEKVMSSSHREVKNDKGFSKDNKYSIAGITFEHKSAQTSYGDQHKMGMNILGLAKAEKNIRSNQTKDGLKDTTETKFSLMGLTTKNIVEETYNKQGELTSKVSVNEKSFMGITIGRTTTLDDKSKDTHNYSKNEDKINNPKLVDQKEISNKDEMKQESKNMDKDIKSDKKETALLVVDEASMMSAKDMNVIFKEVEQLSKEGYNVRVELMGDSKQLQAIGSGSSFDQIKEQLGDKVAEMTESQRQRNTTEQGITNPIAQKDIKTAFDNMEKAGAIKEVKDPDQRINAVVDAITKKENVDIQNFKGETETKNIDYKNTIGLASTNKENQAINAGVRNELKNQGLIKNEVKTSINVGVLKNSIKQSNAVNYEKGMEVKTFEKVNGMAKNTNYKVVDINKKNNSLTLKTTEPDKNGNHKYTNVKTKDIAGKVTISQKEERSFGEGDKIRITETNKKAGLTNSDQGIITNMDQKNKIATIDFGEKGTKQVDLKQQKGIEYGYSMTNHSAQGISVDRVVATFDTSKNAQMNTMNSTYVAMSRQSAKSVAITDNKENLMNQASKEAKNVSTLDNLKDEKSNNKVDQKTENQSKEKNDVSKDKLEIDSNSIKDEKSNNKVDQKIEDQKDKSVDKDKVNRVERQTINDLGDSKKSNDKFKALDNIKDEKSNDISKDKSDQKIQSPQKDQGMSR